MICFVFNRLIPMHFETLCRPFPGKTNPLSTYTYD